jgi:hypothetical protein
VLIDCDTCTVRGHGCDDCVVTVLLGAPPGWRGSDPTVVPLGRRRSAEHPVQHPVELPVEQQQAPVPVVAGDAPGRADSSGDLAHVDDAPHDPWSVVELDEVEQQAVRALAEFGLVPPLRHQDASTSGSRHVS